MTDSFNDRAERYLTEAETARVLRLTPRTLQRFRRSGAGPRFVKMGARVRYRIADLAAWTNANTHAIAQGPSAGLPGERS
jgi:predicted DNA-binding transcriptional regulator AlpA